MPCCMAPTNKSHLHFANLTDNSGGVTNSDGFRRARLSIVDRPAYDAEATSATGREPYCAECKTAPQLNFLIHPHVGMQLPCLDHGRVFGKPAVLSLTEPFV
jgi:hypothetical protein